MEVRFGVDPTGALQQQGAQNPATQSGSRVAGDDLQAGQGAGRRRITTLAAADEIHGSGFFAGQKTERCAAAGYRRAPAGWLAKEADRRPNTLHPLLGPPPASSTVAISHTARIWRRPRRSTSVMLPRSGVNDIRRPATPVPAHNRHRSTSPHNRRKRAGERGRASGVRTAMLCGNRHVLPSPRRRARGARARRSRKTGGPPPWRGPRRIAVGQSRLPALSTTAVVTIESPPRTLPCAEIIWVPTIR